MLSDHGTNGGAGVQQHPRHVALLRSTIRLTLAAALIAVLTSTTSLTDEQNPAPPTEQIERGIVVYKANYCGACHSLAAAGTTGAFGPTHDGMAATAADRLTDPNYTGSATTPEEYILESILEPMVYLAEGYIMTPHAMPSFAHLADEDVNALTTLLMAQDP